MAVEEILSVLEREGWRNGSGRPEEGMILEVIFKVSFFFFRERKPQILFINICTLRNKNDFGFLIMWVAYVYRGKPKKSLVNLISWGEMAVVNTR